MQGNLKQLIETFAQAGQVQWIGVRPARRSEMVSLTRVEVSENGLEGDHGASAKRALTLLQYEHLAAIGSYLGRQAVAPTDLRRNIVVAGINLAALKGRRLALGGAVLEVSGICAPCSRMEETLGVGGYSAVRGHGGWCARVLIPGPVQIGDAVRPLTTDGP